MKKIIKKFLIFLFALATQLTCSSCGIIGDTIIQEGVDVISPDIADKIIEEFSPEKNDDEPAGEDDPLHEHVIYETVLLEDIIKENKLTEDILEEQIENELILDEDIARENVTIESVKVEILNDKNDVFEYFKCESYYTGERDYALIKQRITDGLKIVLAEVLINTGSFVVDICTANWGEAILDGTQVVVMAAGTTLTAYTMASIAKAKSLAAGNTYEEACYDALFEGSKGFYYSALIIDGLGTLVNLGQLAVAGGKFIKNVTKAIKDHKINRILNKAGKKIGEVKPDKSFDLEIGNKKLKAQMTNTANPNSSSFDIFDTKTQKYLGTLRPNAAGDAFDIDIKSIPQQIFYQKGPNKGKPKFTFQGNECYKSTYTKAGKETKTLEGLCDESGFITNNFGQITKKIDFETGKEFDGFSNFIHTASNKKITPDKFGVPCEVDPKTKQYTPLTKKMYEGKPTYFDSDNKPVLFEYDGEDGTKYLKKFGDFNDQKTAGILQDGSMDFNWKNLINYRRSSATKKIRKGLVDYVSNKDIMEVRKNFPQLSYEMIDYIKTYKKVPSSIQIHHVKNVANFPDLSDDLTNLVCVTREQHKKLHFGDFRNATTEKPSFYINLKVLFDL